MSRSRRRYDVFDLTDDVEIAHAVSATVAAELVGLPVDWIEANTPFSVTNFAHGSGCQELEVRTSDDP